MQQANENIKVLVAARKSITRLGIQSLILKSGVEASCIEAQNLEQVRCFLKSDTPPEYMLIVTDILPLPPETYIEEFKENSQRETKVLFICNNRNEISKTLSCIPDDLSEDDCVTSLLKFFRNSIADNSETEDPVLLSEREMEVLREVALGYANKEIADRLFISINTVITHRKNITEKLGIKTIAGLTVYALMNDLISPGDVRG